MTPGRPVRALVAQASLAQASWVGVRVMMGYRALELGADPFLLAVIAALFAAPSIITALPLGRLSDRVGGGIVASSGIALTGVALVALLELLLLLLVLPFAVLGRVLLGHHWVIEARRGFTAVWEEEVGDWKASGGRIQDVAGRIERGDLPPTTLGREAPRGA